MYMSEESECSVLPYFVLVFVFVKCLLSLTFSWSGFLTFGFGVFLCQVVCPGFHVQVNCRFPVLPKYLIAYWVTHWAAFKRVVF